MAVSIHQASVPIFERCLNAFSAIVDKAAAHAAAHKVDPSVYLATRLRPDMLDFVHQTQIFCDFAKNTTGRLGGGEVPKFEDSETTFDDIKARIKKTVDYITSVSARDVDAGANREIVFPMGPNAKMKMKGDDYLLHYALPNFYFHLTTAYDLLRFNGVDIGKRDFMGAVPRISPA